MKLPIILALFATAGAPAIAQIVQDKSCFDGFRNTDGGCSNQQDLHDYTKLLDEMNAFDSALGRLKTSDAVGAIAILDRVLSKTATSPRAYHLRGVAYAKKDDCAAAILDFTRAIQLEPKFVSAHIDRAKCRHLLQQHALGMLDVSKAIELQPKNAEYYKLRSSILATLGNFDKALLDSDKAIELQPNHAESYILRSSIKSDMGNYEKALIDDNKAAELQPKNAASYKSRSSIKYKMGDYNGALTDANKAISLNPSEIIAYIERGKIHKLRGDKAQASLDFSNAFELLTIEISKRPANPNNYNGRAWVSFLNGTPERGIKDIEQSLKLRPNFAKALDTRGHILAALGKRAQAITDFRHALKLQPHLQSSIDGLAELGEKP
jgi:tetratricopeptide (TPR) repeat protein